jgi:hypothetical protein
MTKKIRTTVYASLLARYERRAVTLALEEIIKKVGVYLRLAVG